MDITGFLKGRVRVKIHGRQPERFLNLALRSNIFLSDIEKKNEDIYFTVSPKGFLMLRHIARKTGIRAKIIKKSGFFIWIRKLKQRKIPAVLFAVLFIVILFLSSMVLKIEITGNEILQNDEIIAKLHKIGLKKFTFRSNIDTEDIKLKLIDEFPVISWAGVYENGTRITVEIKERVLPPSIVDKNLPCDLVAKKDGRIISVVAENGEKAVSVGDSVKKGQVLLSGAVPVKNSEEKRYVHSMGSIIAETVSLKAVDVKLYEYIREYTGKSFSYNIIKVNGKTVFGEKHCGHINCDRGEKRRVLGIFEFNTVTCREYTLKKTPLDEKTAVEKACSDIEAEFRAETEGEIISIVHRNAPVDGETVRLESAAYIREEIAEEKEIEEWMKESSAEENPE